MTVVIVGGHAGSGKSTFSQLLHSSLNRNGVQSGVVDKDTVTLGATEAVLQSCGKSVHDREGEEYLRWKAHEYAIMARVAKSVQDEGSLPIMCAPDLALAEEHAKRSGLIGPIHCVWLEVAPKLRRGRLILRGLRRDDAKLLNWRNEPHPSDGAVRYATIIENDLGLQDLSKKAGEFIEHI